MAKLWCIVWETNLHQSNHHKQGREWKPNFAQTVSEKETFFAGPIKKISSIKLVLSTVIGWKFSSSQSECLKLSLAKIDAEYLYMRLTPRVYYIKVLC